MESPARKLDEPRNETWEMIHQWTFEPQNLEANSELVRSQDQLLILESLVTCTGRGQSGFWRKPGA